MILPIEKYRLIKLIQLADAVDVTFLSIFFTAREGSDSQNVDRNNSVKSQTVYAVPRSTMNTKGETEN